MPAKHAELLTKSYKKKNMTDQLIFLKPGQYMSSSDNRFVTFRNKQPCLILEKRERFIDGIHNASYPTGEASYVVLANNEQLVAVFNNFVTEGEMK